MQEWHVHSRRIDEVVVAADQWAAWNTLRMRPIEDFGLVVVASADGNEDKAIPVQTAALMRSWGRIEDAAAFDGLARVHGLL